MELEVRLLERVKCSLKAPVAGNMKRTRKEQPAEPCTVFVKTEVPYFILKRTKHLLNMNIHESIDKWIVLILPVCIPEVLFLN